MAENYHLPSPSRELVECVVLDTLISPTSVTEIAKSYEIPDFDAMNIAHGALVAAAKMFPGRDREAIAASRAFLLGAGFVLKTFEQTSLADKYDTGLFNGELPAA